MSADRDHAELDRLMRSRPTSFTEARAYREAIDRTNRETRDRLRRKRGVVVFSI
jgi:hypothetical protein